MRFFKKTIFWFIALAVIGGSFYLIDRKAEEKKIVKEIRKRLFPFEPKDVVEFQILRTNGKDVTENTLLRKEGDEWFMESPLRAKGDKEVIQNLLNGVVNVRYDGILFENQPPEKLKEMGIADSPTSLEVHFRTAAPLVKTIVFGDRNPGMNLGFAILKDDPRIFRLTADIKAEADKTVYDLRDKTVIDFAPLKIKGFKIRWLDGKEIAVDHPAEGKWHIVKPKNAIANALKITELLYKIKGAKIKAFADEDPKDLSIYGLSEPKLKINIFDETGKNQELLIGERDKKQRGLFAKRGDAKNVFVLEEEFILNIPKSQEEIEEAKDDKKTKNQN